MPRSIRHAVLALAFLALTAVPASAAEPLSYVALGDSYSAGPFIQPQDPQQPGCLRSLVNYPHLLAARLRTASFQDVSCTGATTRDMFAPQAVNGGSHPAQLDALNSTTRLVTLQVGGNDIGFTEIATSCLTLTPLGTPCTTRYSEGGVDVISKRIAETAPAVDGVLAAINAKAPAAKVFVVGYPSLLPENAYGCWPFMPFAPGDVPYLVAKTKELNSMLSSRAAAAGAIFVDTYTPSLGRDACTLPLIRWVEPVLVPLLGLPVHPNQVGMIGTEAAVAGAIGSNPR